MNHTPYVFKHAEPVAYNPAISAREVELAKMILRTICEEYPGHLWRTMVWIDEKTRGYMLGIGLNILMDPNDWYIVHSEQMGTYQDFRRRLRDASGKLLERFDQPRGARDLDRFLIARANGGNALVSEYGDR